jgi:hypothetical protein
LWSGCAVDTGTGQPALPTEGVDGKADEAGGPAEFLPAGLWAMYVHREIAIDRFQGGGGTDLPWYETRNYVGGQLETTYPAMRGVDGRTRCLIESAAGVTLPRSGPYLLRSATARAEVRDLISHELPLTPLVHTFASATIEFEPNPERVQFIHCILMVRGRDPGLRITFADVQGAFANPEQGAHAYFEDLSAAMPFGPLHVLPHPLPLADLERACAAINARVPALFELDERGDGLSLPSSTGCVWSSDVDPDDTSQNLAWSIADGTAVAMPVQQRSCFGACLVDDLGP